MMIKKVEWIIALRYLRTKNKEGFISIVSAFSLIGIALGVATLIIVMSVMSGYEKQLIERILGMNGHIVLNTAESQIKDYDKFAEELQAIEHVKFASPLVHGQAMIVFGKQAKGALIRGMSTHSLQKKVALKNIFTTYEISCYQNNEGILIGESMARELGLHTGDYVKLIAPKFESLAFGIIPRIKTFKIIGTFDVGMHEYNSSTIFMPLKFAQLFFDYQDRVSDFEVNLDDINNLHQVKQEILDLPESNSLFITDWTSTNRSLMDALRIERNVMFLILSLIILIAAFNIISSLIMLVQDKKRSIAILRTIGLNKNSILKIFIICGSVIGLAGTVIGSIVGVVFTLNIEKIRSLLEKMTGYALFDPVIYFLTSLPAELSIQDTVMIVALSVLLAFLATIYPAWKAASIMPAVALRYE